jgi:putative ABC transport system substrate-binding protein
MAMMLFAVVAGLLAVPFAMAQVPTESLHLGLIEFSSPELRTFSQQALLDALRKQGYVQGRNLILERRYADGRPERVEVIAKELAAMRLNAIVSTCTLKRRRACRVRPRQLRS